MKFLILNLWYLTGSCTTVMLMVSRPNDPIYQPVEVVLWWSTCVASHVAHCIRSTLPWMTVLPDTRVQLLTYSSASKGLFPGWAYGRPQFLNSRQADCFWDLQKQFPDLPLAEEISNFFVSVSAHLHPFNPSLLISLSALTLDHTDQFIIQRSQVESKLLRINVHKSPGPDGLPNWLLKEFAPILCDLLAAIFNSPLWEGYVPPVWKSVQVMPVRKTNPPSSIESDLRPIAILPVLAKVLKSIVGRHLLQFLEPNFDDSQFGSRKGRSITHAVLALLDSWMESLDSGGLVCYL